jgi:4-hydroxy-tetrahydrodipicolinate reductase
MKKMPQKRRDNVLICGANGRMGQQLCELLKNHTTLRLGASFDRDEIQAFDEGHTAVLKSNQSSLDAIVTASDLIIDFSSPAATKMLVKSLQNSQDKVVLIGTTGLDDSLKLSLMKAAKKGGHKVLIAGNTSLGIFTLAQRALETAKTLPPAGFDVEITETHHRMKVDAPSGTALLLAEVIKSSMPGSKIVFNRDGARKPNSIGLHSIRGGGVIGEHQVRFIADEEEVCLSHRAFSRALFAKGALSLASSIAMQVKSGESLNLSDYIIAQSRDKATKS